MKQPIELKVKWATYAALLLGGVVAALNWAAADSELLGGLPPWLQAAVSLLVPPVVTFLSGWQAAHTPRQLGPETNVPQI